jgi:hypothetical protein
MISFPLAALAPRRAAQWHGGEPSRVLHLSPIGPPPCPFFQNRASEMAAGSSFRCGRYLSNPGIFEYAA